MDDLKARTLSGLGWSGATQTVCRITQFVVGVVLARILDPGEFGLLAMIIVFTGFANLFTSMGFGQALIQKADLKQRHLDAVFWINIVAGLSLTLIVAACAPLLGSFYDRPILQPLVIVLALNFTIGSVHIVPRVLIQKSMDFRRLSRIETLAALLGGAVAIGMAMSGLGVWSLVGQSIVFTTVSSATTWYLSDWRPTFSWKMSAARELSAFSTNLLGFNVLNYWMRNLDNLLIGKRLGSAPLGVYSRAYSLMMMPISQISGAISHVMFPALSSIQGDKPRVKRIYLQATRSISLLTFPLMIGLLAVARPFVVAVYGAQWQNTIPILRIFCLMGVVHSIGTTVGWIYTSQGRTDLMLRWGLFASAAIAISFVVGLRWGAVGVAAAYAVSTCCVLWYPSWAIPGRLINLRFFEMLRNLAPSFFCAALMGVVVALIGLVLPPHWASWLCLLFQVGIGVVAYLLFVRLFKVSAYTELRSIVAEHLRGSSGGRPDMSISDTAR